MYYYFYSESPSALKINGAFYGILSKGVKSLKIDYNSPFLELCPVSVYKPCVNLLLDENFLSSPCPSVSVTDLKGGYLIKFNPLNNVQEFAIITQQKYADALVTVFNENGLKLSIETRNDFYAETLNKNIKGAQIKDFSLNNTRFVAIELENDTSTLCVYKISDKVEKVFCREITRFSTDNEFITVESFRDIAKHVVTTKWEFVNNTFKIKSADVIADENFNLDNLNERLIPYCFLEKRLTGANCSDYLCGNVLQNESKLNGFLGPYIGVMPPPPFRNIDEIGLIYSKSENLYQVEYFKFTLENRKISNIIKCD